MKIKKGEYGYIKSQKKIRVIRTIAAFAFDFAIFFVGLYLNKGDRRNIYSIIAAVGCIPAAMSLVSAVMICLRKPMKETLFREISDRAGNLRMLYELYLTTQDKNLFLDAVAVCGEYITGYTSEDVKPGHIREIESHIRRSALKEGYKETVKIFDNKNNFLERVDQLREKKEDFEMDRDAELESLLKVLAI
uniref:hypothetical protein n=1 Tax=Eubacterium cellulosolvens TaxID=29322 RepID=UPI00068423AA|nr:hypothetical protein [[Eubacterium] cellulosolvens]